MAKEETLKEAWEKLPAWKKTWFKIVAIMFVLALISSCGSCVQAIQQQNAMEKEVNKILEEVKF